MFSRMEPLRDFETAVQAYVIDSQKFTCGKMSVEEIRTAALNSILLSMDRGGSLQTKEYKTLRHLIEVAGPQLTSEDPQCRRNSMTLLGLVLTRCPALKTPADVVESLVAFCSGRLFDWYSVEGAMLVYSGLLEHHLEVVRWGSVEMDYYDVIPHDDENCDPQYGSQKTRRLERFTCARVIFESILKRVHAPGFSQSIRGTILKVLSCILTEFSEDVRDAGPRIVTGICCQVENEKDPRNLMLSFPLMKTLLSDFDDLIREDLQHCDLISDVLLAYFPIRFKPPPNDPFGVTESDLCGQLRECLVVNKRLGSHALNVILDVLNDGLAANNEFDVIESVETLKFCFQHFEVATLIAHAQPLLEVIKLAAWQSPCQYLPILAESLSALIAAGISKSEGSTVTLHEISGCIRRLLQQCVEHMAKPQMLPGSCGLISSRLVFLEIVKLNSDAAGTGWEVVMHVLSPFSSVKNMLATLSNSVQSDLTRGTETQQLDSPTASWERVAMDLDFLQKLVEAQETLEAASEATVSLLDILATYSGCILRHKPTAGSSLMTSIARCSLLSVGPSSISEASSSVGSIGCMVSTFAYILGLPRENDSTVQNWVEEWRTYVTQSMRVNGQSLLVDKSSSVSILLQTISLMVEKSLIARTVAFPLLRQYFQNVILDQSSVVKFTNEEKTRAEVVSQIAYKCISAAALNRDPCDSASKLVTLLFSIAVSEVSVVHPQHMIGNSLWVLETVLRCLWSAIRPVISDSETRPYCSIIIGEFINGMDAFFLKRNGPAVILLQSVTESQSEGVLKSFRLLLSSSITLVDDISKLANYLEVSMSILETQQSTGALLLIPCILPRVLALCEETEPVEQLLGRLQTICFSVACPVQGLLSRSVDEVDAARSILASLVFRGPEGCTATVLASMRARWQAACSGSGQPISERVDVSITQGWILRALWTRQFSQRSIPQISAFNEILELIQAGVECDSELQFLAPETFSVVVGPLQSAAAPASDAQILSEGLPTVPRSEVLRLVQSVFPSLLSTVAGPGGIEMRVQATCILFCLLASLSVEDIASLQHFDLSDALVLACSSTPWVAQGPHEDGTLLYLQFKVDELSGGVIVVLLKLLEGIERSELTKIVYDNISVVVASCIRQSTNNSIPWIRQAAGRCLIRLANSHLVTSAMKHQTRVQVVRGLRSVLNDPSREVRRTAALCCNLWSCQ